MMPYAESLGAAIYYNTAVPTPGSFQPGRSMKYGVVSTAHLRQDLVEWTWLYVAGKDAPQLEVACS